MRSNKTVYVQVRSWELDDLHDRLIRLRAINADLLKTLEQIPQRYLEDMDRHTPAAANAIRAVINRAKAG